MYKRQLRTLTTSSVTKQLSKWFWDFGFPKAIRSDGGPQFRTEFENYCESLGIKREKSLPYNPQSNGLAEAAVKQMKRLIKKVGSQEELFRPALLTWRNTPRADGISPSQLMFGFIQSFGQGKLYVPSFIDRNSASQTRQNSKLKMKEIFDKRSNDLPTLLAGQSVKIQNPKGVWDKEATIINSRENARSYEAQGPDGESLLRNRRLLKAINSWGV